MIACVAPPGNPHDLVVSPCPRDPARRRHSVVPRTSRWTNRIVTIHGYAGYDYPI